MIKIFIDADACPVKEEVYKVSIRNKLEVLIVSNGGIRPHPNQLIKSIFVGKGFNSPKSKASLLLYIAFNSPLLS